MCSRNDDPSQTDKQIKCRDRISCGPHRPCGHPVNSPLCACVKVRREPISAEKAFALLARSL